ncbi:MAG TPA: ERCC4 domain-containing protein [Conexivisphaerales archaeon]|nr:ERCC4 domain-containing protein [Conexivisphaerales archaeon]
MDAAKIRIVCDERERASGVPQALMDIGVAVDFSQLKLGDYILSPSTAVERKSVRDFVSSLYDGRLFNQVNELTRSFPNAFVLVEGDPAEISMISRNPRSYYGAMAALTLTFNVKTIFTPSPEDTALALAAMASRLGRGGGARPSVIYQAPPKSVELHKEQVYLVSSLPGVGPNLAKRLLERFGTPRGVFAASVPQLAMVSGVGRARAEKIAKALTSAFKGVVEDATPSLDEKADSELKTEG